MEKVLNSAPNSKTSFAAGLTIRASRQLQRRSIMAVRSDSGGTGDRIDCRGAIGNLRQGSSFSSFSGTFAGLR